MFRFRSVTGLAALRHRPFALFVTARFLVVTALQMQSVAVGWQVYALTGDPLYLGLVGLAQFLPFFLLILLAGQTADRHDRRRILAIGFSVEWACALLLLAYTLSELQVVWPVLAVMAVHGAARAFMMPASQALVIKLVPPEDFSNAVALNSSAFQVAVIAGPALGGVLYLAGPTLVYGTATLALAAAAMLMWRLGWRAQAREAQPAADPGALLEGLRFVRSRPVVLGAISLDLFAVLFGGATALLPAYASDILQVGPAGLGLLRGAPALGAAITALVLAALPITRCVGRWMFGGVALFGVATLVFGLSRDFVLSCVALLVLGAGDMVSVYIRQLLVQLETPDAIRGRVSAVNAVFIGTSNELGEFESGITAAWFGLVPAVVVGGAATLLVAGLWMWRFPALRDADRFPEARG
jgi:MFS family permease